ncbi:MAG: enoyl-CoA hydratase/isomerase family protein [Rhodovarius sp.]|nr:enoyl-CoA hydratase/isomerase family protein [Rhodovarius sp.]MCX7930912.1 enoyl-CoA hydratase/isomerase family protein [Rhodovarius sp.]MDW8313662.1 enoyl-CoA hydratase/isomerase family protein [Rhodovarius sp.]
MSEALRIVQDGRLLRITLAREDGGVTDSMAASLAQALLMAHENADAVLLTSAGPDFCTGRVRDLPGPPAPEAYARRPEYDSVFNSYRAIRNAQVPVVCAIAGRAMGYGTAVAALCDVSFAADTARFNIPEITHNVMPTMVMSALYDRVNRNAILWMAYSAEFIGAQRALEYGIVSQVVPEAQLAAEVERFCATLLSRPRPAILGLKEYLRVAPRMDEQGATDYARALHSMVNTAAAMKGPRH